MAEQKTSDRAAGDRQKALASALAQIEKDYGKGAVMRLGEHSRLNVSTIPTGSLSLDIALGVGGLPRGRIIEVFGPESSGKTTLTLHVIAAAQKGGGEAAFIDAEHALDPTYAVALGVDIENLLIAQPDNGEQALEITEKLVNSGALDVIVVDSVAALVPRAEIQGEMGDSFVGLHARLMSQALRKLAGVISRTNTVVIFINQLREKIGQQYGPSEVTTGGRALKFYASVRIDVRKKEALKVNDITVGNRTAAKVVKNKIAPPFKEGEFDILFGQGISYHGELLDLGIMLDLVQKSGSWFSAGDIRLGQGREAARQYLQDNPELAKQLDADIRANTDRLNLSIVKGKRKLTPVKDTKPVKSKGPIAVIVEGDDDDDD
jgi:recombination protein RecA